MKLLLLACALIANAQTFDVASVKPAGPWLPNQRALIADPGRITFPRSDLAMLLIQAYNVFPDQIVGPAWLNDANTAYTVTATFPPGAAKDEWRVMLQNLLAERFRLRLHHEQQTRPGYELIVADGGHKLKPWTSDAGANAPSARFVFPMSGAGRIRFDTHGELSVFCRGLGHHINLSNGVPSAPQPRVVDRTGLRGVYDFHVEYNGVVTPGASAAALDEQAADPGPNIFTALEKQLGLKLRKTGNVTVDVLVVDHADKVPAEN